MKPQTLKELHHKDLLTDGQFSYLEAILSKKIFSVFYELRTLLYLGVLLFTTGIGILINENIGDIGHLLSIGLLCAIMVVCFFYAFNKTGPYSNGRVKSPTPYFDYIVLLGALLYISVQGYLQFQFGVLDENLGLFTLLTAALFFFLAYRFDHLGVLSLAITAFASFWSLSVSPQKWYEGDFIETAKLHNTALIFGGALAIASLGLDKKSIKRHFTFTYIHFSTLLFLSGALSGMFINDDSYAVYLLLLYGGCAFAVYYARQRRSFLLLLYAFIFGYIGTTFFLADTVLNNAERWFFYLVISCGGFVFFIINYRNYFKRSK